MARWPRSHAAGILRKGTALGYTVNGDCNRCGICAKVCPADNIAVTEDGVRFSKKCEAYFARLRNCPQAVIHMPVEARAKRLRDDRISLADIVRANG